MNNFPFNNGEPEDKAQKLKSLIRQKMAKKKENQDKSRKEPVKQKKKEKEKEKEK